MSVTAEQLESLGDFFAPEDLEWKPVAVSKKTQKGLAVAYIDNRAIMARLDAVCGPANWWNEFREGPQGGILCGLTIRTDAGEVTKWDGAENTDIESVKGGLSGSMRRAAVHWNIGRYLYSVPQRWVPIDEWGKFKDDPQVPREFLPKGTKQAAPAPQPAARPAAVLTKQQGQKLARSLYKVLSIGSPACYEFASHVLNRPDVYADLAFEHLSADDATFVFEAASFLGDRLSAEDGFTPEMTGDFVRFVLQHGLKVDNLMHIHQALVAFDESRTEVLP